MGSCDIAIRVRGMMFSARHGVYQEERTLPRPFEVDVEVRGDFSRPAESDDLGDSYDYGRIVDAARTVMEGEPVSLIEHLAARIAGKVAETAPAGSSITVRVRKPAAPLDIPFETVEVELQTRVEL